MTALDRVLKAAPHVEQHGKIYKALCPCHRDENPSVEISQGEKGALVICRANCDTKDVLAAWGLTMSDLFDEKGKSRPKRDLPPIEETYTYRDEIGGILFQVTRHKPKTFRQRRYTPDAPHNFRHLTPTGEDEWRNEPYTWKLDAVRRVLYRLPRLIATQKGNDAFGIQPNPNPTVYVCEGEKDVKAIERAGGLATCNPGGANKPGKREERKWLPEYDEMLRGFHVVLVRDRDEAGYAHVKALKASLTGFAASIRCVEAKSGKDAFDHLDAGHGLEDFVEADADEECPEDLKKSKPDLAQGILAAIEDGGLRTIQWNARQIRDVTADAIAALVETNDPPRLFARGGKIVRVVEDKDGRFKIDSLGPGAMRNELAKSADWVRVNDKGNLVPGYVPKEIAENVLAEQGLSKRFPRLEGLSTMPVLSSSGTFHREHGYDPESGFYVTDHGPFPTHDGDGKHAAAWVIRELFQDFPFDGDASLANTLALALLPCVRPYIQGPTPMHYVEAPQSRTGKSLLVEVALLPSLGPKSVSSTPLPEKEEELSKTIAGMIYEGDQLIFMDNVKRRVSSSSLEQILTAHHLKFRPLGATLSLQVPVKAIWALTTNNGTVSVDMAGRCVHIRIDAKMERPEDRETFYQADIRAFIESHRPEIRAALMAMVEEWVIAGRPKGPRRKAGFEEWSYVIGGILETCGVDGFLANDKALKGTAADEDEPWRDFYGAWWSGHGDDPVSGPTLLKMAREKNLLEDVFAKAKSERGFPTAFGAAMASREGKVLDGKRLESMRNPEGKPYKLNGEKMFRLLSVDGAHPPPVNGQSGFVYDAEEVDPFADPGPDEVDL